VNFDDKYLHQGENYDQNKKNYFNFFKYILQFFFILVCSRVLFEKGFRVLVLKIPYFVK